MAPNLIGFTLLLIYYIISAGLLGLTSHFFHFPKEIIRKAYHLMACFSIFIILEAFNTWQGALAGILTLVGLVWIILPLATRLSVFKKITIARSGVILEVLKQATYFFATIIVLILAFWYLTGPEMKYHIIVGIGALALGDTAAALIGKKFGKKKLTFPMFDPNKTLVGTLAMIVASVVSIFITLAYYNPISITFNLVSALILAIIAAIVEAVAIKGLDTIMIPTTVACASFGLLLLYNWWLL